MKSLTTNITGSSFRADVAARLDVEEGVYLQLTIRPDGAEPFVLDLRPADVGAFCTMMEDGRKLAMQALVNR